MQAQLKQSKNNSCTTCGARYSKRARFCGLDGTVLQAGVVNAGVDPEGKYCTRCSRFFPAYAQFCPTDASTLEVNRTRTGPLLTGRGADASSKEAPEEVQVGRFVPYEEEIMQGRNLAGKYRIDNMLGQGGMARVYLATHLELEKQVVVKIMHDHLAGKDDSAFQRFIQESKVTARLNHPNLVSVSDCGEHNGRPYIVMEYIKGSSLRAYLLKNGVLSFDDTINIISQTCLGLHEAHAEGIVHRDLKPDNIMLREQSNRPDWVKIVDFGVAHLKQGGSKLTETGMSVGTVDYMSPEYLKDEALDLRTDMYAVGVILYELLTGKSPFSASTPGAVIAKHIYTTAMPPSSEREDMKPGCMLDMIVEHALEKDPDKRFQSALEMRDALQLCRVNPGGN